MGLHVFGALTLAFPNGYPNFDTFLNAMVSTFNILNLENWNQQMYAVINASNWGTTAYYLLWIIIGTCVHYIYCFSVSHHMACDHCCHFT
jgi:hypothetical protein